MTTMQKDKRMIEQLNQYTDIFQDAAIIINSIAIIIVALLKK